MSKETEGTGSLVRNQDEEGSLIREVSSLPDSGSLPCGSPKDGPYIPLHALLFLLGDLYMKTPQDIREKVEIA